MKCGIGIRPELFEPVFEQRPEFGFLEAHSENYFGESIARAKLLELREHYPVSLHGVGLSLGRADHLNQQHLNQLKSLVDEVDPLLVSEHLAWSAYSHRHVPDLLPLPLTDAALQIMCEHIDQMQSALGRQILLENPSNYLLFDELQIPEPEFLNEIAHRTGCGLLVDVNNIHVSASNLGRDGAAYIDALNSEAIGQFHLAGYTESELSIDGITETVLIDTHNQTVFDPVWALFDHALTRHGGRPTLFEWDSDYPEFSVLLGECAKADSRIEKVSQKSPSSKKPEVIKHHVGDEIATSQTHFLDSMFALEKTLPAAIKEHQHRIWIYQNNVFAATREYLEEVYPATKGVVGADFFKQMTQLYIQRMPPSEGNIHLYGDTFADILTSFAGLKKLPYLSSLIEYEWALHSAYFSEISDSLDPTAVEQDELLTMPVMFNASVQVIKSHFPIYEIHRQSLPEFEGEISIDLGQSQDTVVVFKQQFKVVSRVVNDLEATMFDEIKKSQHLLQAIEGLQGSIPPEILSSTLTLVFDARLLKAA